MVLPLSWPETDCDWALLHQKSLYALDERGRISEKGPASTEPAPLFHLVRTRHGNVWCLHSRLSSTVCRDLARLAGREAPLGRAVGSAFPPPERMESMLAVLRSVKAEPSFHRGALYRFPLQDWPSRPPKPEGMELERILPQQAAALSELTPPFSSMTERADPDRPMVVARVEGEAVALCYGAKSASQQAMEGRVETLPGYRRRGLARACLVEWARTVAETGVIPLARARWENRGACAFAQSLGLEVYADGFWVDP